MVGPWNHGTVVGRRNHNNNNRSYMIYISKIHKLFTRNSKHINTTPITTGQYLLVQSDKSFVDTEDDILKQFEKHTQQNVTHTHDEQVNKDTPENITNDRQQSNMQDNIKRDFKPSWMTVNNK